MDVVGFGSNGGASGEERQKGCFAAVERHVLIGGGVGEEVVACTIAWLG